MFPELLVVISSFLHFSFLSLVHITEHAFFFVNRIIAHSNFVDMQTQNHSLSFPNHL
jgi:hypothetical protein